MTICKLTQKSCDNYEGLQNALTIVIILVIIGTDYLQIAIILAVNTRKNKKIKKEDEIIEKKNVMVERKHKEYIEPEPMPEPEQSIEEKLVDAINEDPDFGKEELADGVLTGEEVAALFEKASKRPNRKKSVFSHPFKFVGPKPQ